MLFLTVMRDVLCVQPHQNKVWQESHVCLVPMSSPDKRPQMQCCRIHGLAMITLRQYPGNMPKLHQKSYRIQQRVGDQDPWY